MDALIFDFDGVVVDSEPIHLACFRQVLRGIGLELSREDYYTNYLGYDDRGCFQAIARANGLKLEDRRVTELIAAKTLLVQEVFGKTIQPLPGAVALIASAAAAGMPLAICSGALRGEIELAAETVGVRRHFAIIVAAEDVAEGKPDPQGYLLALRRLRQATRRDFPPAKCVVVEDSSAGIEAAHAAGMKVLAVATSYPAAKLWKADRVVESLTEATVDNLSKWFG